MNEYDDDDDDGDGETVRLCLYRRRNHLIVLPFSLPDQRLRGFKATRAV